MPNNRGATMPFIYSEYKPQARKTLSLTQRIEVIREYDRYERKPTLKHLATKFGCGSKQIKKILLNRSMIVDAYNIGSTSTTYVDSDQKAKEQIEFLGKVMYEYVQRMLYFNHSINDHKFKVKALQMKECMGLENFEPTKFWMDEFKNTYGIQDFDISSLRNNIVLPANKRPYLGAVDIIQYVRRMEHAAVRRRSRCTNKKHNNTITDSNARFSSIDDSDPEIVVEIKEGIEELQKLISNITSQPQPNSSSSTIKKSRTKRPGPQVAIEIEDEEDEELQKLNLYTPTPPIQQTSHSTTTQKIATKRRVSSILPKEDHGNTNYNLTENISSPDPKAIIKIDDEDEELQKFILNINPKPQQNSSSSTTKKSTTKRPEPQVAIEIEDEDEELRKLNLYTPTPTIQQSSKSMTTQKIAAKRQASSPFSDTESVDRALKYLKALEKSQIDGNRSSSNTSEKHSNKSLVSSPEPKVIVETEDEDGELQKLNLNNTTPPKQNSLSSTTKKTATKRRASSPFSDIESVDRALKHLKALEKSQIDGNRSSPNTSEKHSNKSLVASPEPKVIVEIEDEDGELQKLNLNNTTPPKQSSLSSTTKKTATKRRASSPFSDIESVDKALKHLKALEESQIDGYRTSPNISEKYSNTSFSSEVNVIVEIEDEEDEELQKLNVCTPTPPPQQNLLSSTTNKINTKQRAASPFPDIESVDVALKHLKALEEYVMLQDNFRAIGLIAQLEQILQNQQKND